MADDEKIKADDEKIKADDGKIRRSCKNADDPQTVIETFVKHQGIDRDKEIYSLVRFLNSIGGHYVIALDGGWGCGKSFFVRHTMLFHEMLPGDKEAFNTKYNKVKEVEVEGDDGKKKKMGAWEAVEGRCNAICEKEGGAITSSLADKYLYYDAWKNDAVDTDPMVSIIYETLPEYIKNRIRDELKNAYEEGRKELGKWALKKLGPLAIIQTIKFVAKQGVKMSTGLNPEGMIDFILKCLDKESGENTFVKAEKYDDVREEIGGIIERALKKEDKSRFIIFIDELDRCNPLFAVKVLERVKHYFDNPNLVFVFSVNLEQLQHTIRNVYGQEFDAMTYLHRFFDKQISLQRPSIDALVWRKLENHASEEFCKVARYAIDCYKFHIRETLQFLDELDDVCGAISYLIKTQNLKNDIVFKEDPKDDVGTVYNAETNAYFFAFDIIIPLLIGLRIKNRNVYDAVLNDKAVNEDVSEHIQRYFRENRNGLWSRALKSWTPEQMSGHSLTKQDLDRIYSAMFPFWNHDAAATVGQLDFSKRVREQVKELLSGLAKQGQEKESWDSSYQAYWNALMVISSRESEVLDDCSPDISKDRQDIIDRVKGYYKRDKVIYRTEKHEKAGNILIISLSETVQMEFVWCPAGRFTMGSPDGKWEYPMGSGIDPKAELGRADNETPHEVRLTEGFWIGKYPVTQAQYKAITGENPANFNGDTRPVEMVFWRDSVAFCERLNELKIAPEGYRFALPTEAQWEYACRAGTTTALNNGKPLTSEIGECWNLDEVGWYRKNSGKETHPVGEKQPNAWGIYDMHGNVWEWCMDCCDWTPEKGVTTDTYRDGIEDPLCKEGEIRVLRGGSWDTYAGYCRSAGRSNSDLDDRLNCGGFRLALVPEQKTASA